MALNSTINKISLVIADMDRHYYQSHEITAAQHPSEPDSRFMMRIVAFALHADESLSFTKGLCVDDEPELWRKSLNDTIELWVDFGQLDEKRIRKACSRSEQVVVYTYSERKAQVWWVQIKPRLERFTNLSVYHLHGEEAAVLTKRKMKIQCTIEDGDMYLSDEYHSIHVRIEQRK